MELTEVVNVVVVLAEVVGVVVVDGDVVGVVIHRVSSTIARLHTYENNLLQGASFHAPTVVASLWPMAIQSSLPSQEAVPTPNTILKSSLVQGKSFGSPVTHKQSTSFVQPINSSNTFAGVPNFDGC